MSSQPTPTSTEATTPRITSQSVLDDLCRTITEKRSLRLVEEAENHPQHVPRASGIDKCGRKMQLEIQHWQQRPLFDEHTQGRVERGSAIEKLIVKPELMRMGFELIGGQYACEIRSRDSSRVICTGHIDGLIEHRGQRIVFECKSMHPLLWARMNTVDDLLRHKWYCKYVWQILLYMWANELEAGLILLDDCLGHWKVIPIFMWDHTERTQEALDRCEAVVWANDAGDMLDFCTDAAHCRDCWAFQQGLCSPPLDFSAAGIGMLNDTELAEALERMEELEPEATEYDALDKTVKARIKALTGDQFLAGEFLIQRKESQRKSYTVSAGTSVRVSWSRIIDKPTAQSPATPPGVESAEPGSGPAPSNEGSQGASTT